jgi:hypothetical protein
MPDRSLVCHHPPSNSLRLREKLAQPPALTRPRTLSVCVRTCTVGQLSSLFIAMEANPPQPGIRRTRNRARIEQGKPDQPDQPSGLSFARLSIIFNGADFRRKSSPARCKKDAKPCPCRARRARRARQARPALRFVVHLTFYHLQWS